MDDERVAYEALHPASLEQDGMRRSTHINPVHSLFLLGHFVGLPDGEDACLGWSEKVVQVGEGEGTREGHGRTGLLCQE